MISGNYIADLYCLRLDPFGLTPTQIGTELHRILNLPLDRFAVEFAIKRPDFHQEFAHVGAERRVWGIGDIGRDRRGERVGT